ncbi:MAG TPA: YigZ family protein [Candidatus Faecivivens stercoripullorum]|uniref:YigZ family protein n=1 Tax=Candidatus Faecivivens stercoripullorum TaxID=2840805 RepID=A0A9D1H7F5_9FIRM|nr:YigZ family protein [Candidatus Faecivivens stercoripullorum]
MPQDYLTVRGVGEDEFVEKKSRFIGFAAPVKTVEDANAVIESVRKKHPDARHNVFAYVLLDGMTRRCSDDGEPQGTGGVPVLDVIQKEGLIGVCVVVTRYFGGVLLGASGLARAYGHGARIALDAAGKMHMTNCHVLRVTVPYPMYGKVSYLLPQYKIETLDSVFGDTVVLDLLIRADRAPGFADALRELSAGQIVPELVEERFCDMA